jgi:DEAD/DEAH box helicase domain-containing protein
VSKHVYGYRKKGKLGGNLIEMCDLERPLPPMEFDTRCVWLELPHELRDAMHAHGEAYARGGLHALEHLCIGLSPLCATCESTDLGCQCTRREGDEHAERLLLFERRRGGVGVADALLVELPTLLQAAQARLEACDCDEGCLACVHMSGCGEYNEGLSKPAARAILRWLLQGELPPAAAAGGDDDDHDSDFSEPG